MQVARSTSNFEHTPNNCLTGFCATEGLVKNTGHAESIEIHYV